MEKKDQEIENSKKDEKDQESEENKKTKEDTKETGEEKNNITEKEKDINNETLLTSYMQSFSNKKPEHLYFDKKYQELMKKRNFWQNQPVPKPNELNILKEGALEVKQKKDIPLEKVNLPSNFTWVDFDLMNEKDIEEIYTLLTENYVEDDDGCFRFDYSKEFLRWALLPPHYEKDLYFGIRDKNSENKLVGFISGIVLNLKVEDKVVKNTEVNFLCVHKKYRDHYMASVLIREVVRRSNLKGIWQGLYTSGTMLPTPIAQTRYYHRSLNPRKLISVNFSYLPKNQTISMKEKMYALPAEPELKEGFVLRPTELKDSKQLKKLLDVYLSKFKLYTEYSKKECQHWFIRRENIIESYVIEKNGKITDFFSFYNLPSTILNHKKYNLLKAAYSYYFINNSMSLTDLYRIALITAKNLGYDVFNTLDIMENKQIFEELLYAGGDGYLQYYLYNWKLKRTILMPEEIGVVLM
jgi:glycylpeptide N-tetradecanoyltransferase